MTFSAPPAFYATLVLFVLLAAVAVIDLRRGIIPDWLNGAIAAAGLIRPLSVGAQAMLLAAGEGLLAGAMALVLRWAYRRWRGIQGLGLGDVKFVAAVTPWIGLEALPAALLIASLAGLAAVVCSRLAGNRPTAKTRLPFGPYLALGAAAAWLLGPLI